MRWSEIIDLAKVNDNYKLGKWCLLLQQKCFIRHLTRDMWPFIFVTLNVVKLALRIQVINLHNLFVYNVFHNLRHISNFKSLLKSGGYI